MAGYRDIKNLIDKQIALEEEMRNRGAHKTKIRQAQVIEKENESLTIHGKKLLKTSIENYERELDLFLQDVNRGPKFVATQFLSQLDTKTIAVIAAKRIIDGITTIRKFTAQAISLGGKIEDELYFRKFCETHGFLFDKIEEDLNKRTSHYEYRRWKQLISSKRQGFEWTKWTTREKLLVGEKLISIFIQATNLCKVSKEIKRKRSYFVIQPTEKTLEWIKKVKDFNEFLNAENFPMLIRPRRWKRPIGGGYISRHISPMFLVTGHNITSHRTYLKELHQYDMPGVYQGINAVQDTMWKVNKNILLVAQTVFDNDDRNRGGLVTSKLLDLPNKPSAIINKTTLNDDEKQVLKRWKGEAAAVYTLNKKLGSKRLATAKTIWLGKKFEDETEIGFPHQFDFRGRMYPVPAYLNPQGPDLSKALLKFSNSKPLGEVGERYLCIHLANMYGYDKVPLQERQQWAMKHKEDIIASSQSPFTCNFWEQADKPWQFLAACMEFDKFIKHGRAYECSLPINIDGSCNGLQHFSAMLRDEVGGHAVNLTNTNDPQDIYQIVADKVNLKLKQSDNPYAKQWLDFGVDRKTTKRSVMVLPYGGTRYSCVDFVDDYVEEREERGDRVPFMNRTNANLFLAHIIWDSIGDTVVKAREAMAWLQHAARLCATLKTPVHWVSPLGFPVQQAYYDQKDMVVKTKMMGRIRIKSNTEKINRRKQANGISPNFVHSLDATAMLLTIDHCIQHGIKDFGMVHDSYATLPADMDILNKCTRSAFIQMYTEMDPLDHFREQIYTLLPDKLRVKMQPLPKKGTLDIEEINKATYFFS